MRSELSLHTRSCVERSHSVEQVLHLAQPRQFPIAQALEPPEFVGGQSAAVPPLDRADLPAEHLDFEHETPGGVTRISCTWHDRLPDTRAAPLRMRRPVGAGLKSAPTDTA